MFTYDNLAHSGAIYRDRNRAVLASATLRMRGFEDPITAEALALYKSV